MRRETESGNQVKGHEFSDHYSSQPEDDQPLTGLLIHRCGGKRLVGFFAVFPSPPCKGGRQHSKVGGVRGWGSWGD